MWEGTITSTSQVREVVEASKSGIRQKLKVAFQQLRGEGIYARANFWCCSNCGSSAMWNMWTDNPKFQKKYYGYVFWHQQNEDNFGEGQDIWLGYSSFEEDNDTRDREVAEHVMSVLIHLGIPVKWSGSTSEKIQILVEQTIKRDICHRFAH